MNEVLNQLLNRRTVRSFDKRDISEEDFKSIKKAIMRAPTGGNMTFYSVINVKDQLKKDELAVLCDNQPTEFSHGVCTMHDWLFQLSIQCNL